MSWGIAETASELEKLKSESADYLNGLNSCGEIDYSTYSEAFDFYADLIEKAYRFAKDTNVPCNDTISRQAAIDVAHELIIPMDEYRQYNQGINNYCAEIIKLPSAQPEIIRCKDCLMLGVCRIERSLGLYGYCSQAERRTDEPD